MAHQDRAQTLDPYAVLGVERDATLSDIQAAYRRAAIAANPVKGSSSAALLPLSAAFEVLCRTFCTPRKPLPPAMEKDFMAAIYVEPSTFFQPRTASSSRSAAPAPARPGKGPARPAEMGAGTRKERRLRSALHRLRGVLQKHPADLRAHRIIGMPGPVRVALLQFMESSPRAPGDNGDSRSKKELGLRGAGARLRPFPAPCPGGPGQEQPGTSGSQRVQEGAAAKDLEGPGGTLRCSLPTSAAAGSVRLQTSKQGLFRAKVSLLNMILYGSFASPKVAAEQHVLLAQLQHSVAARLPRGDASSLSEREVLDALLRGAAESLGEKEPVAAEKVAELLEERGIRIYLHVHVAKWLGSTHVTSPVLPLHEVLEIRSRLLRAKSQGWPAFRAAWVALMQHQGSGYRWRQRTAEEAEACAAKAYMNAQRQRACPVKVQVRELPSLVQARRATALDERQRARSLRLEERCAQIVRAVQVSLEALARGTKRTVKQQEKLQAAQKKAQKLAAEASKGGRKRLWQATLSADNVSRRISPCH